MGFNSLNVSLAFLLIAFGFTYLGVGIWEAITAQQNNPKNTDYHGDMIQGYAFCIAKCVINIIFGLSLSFAGLVMTCAVCSGATDVKVNIGGKKSEKNNTSESLIQLVSLGVGIWGLVMYFDDYDLGPFQKIIFAEMIIFFASIGLIALILFGGCCFLCCGCLGEVGSLSIEKREPHFTKISTNTQQATQSKESVVQKPELTLTDNV